MPSSPSGSMESAAACEIARLPEELLSAVISLTSPRDACRAAAVSLAFRAAADSDAVWSNFLPRDLPSFAFADGELPPTAPSKKGLFLRLSESVRPVLLPDGLMCMWLHRETGAKCFMLSARALHISWGDTPCYWRWIPLADSRFSECAELMNVCWLEIRGWISSMALSQRSTYAVYMVFKIDDQSYGLDYYKLPEASICVGESTTSTREVSFVGMNVLQKRAGRWRHCCAVHPKDGIPVPRKRCDGWMELEMGEFYNEEGEDGDVHIKLMETKGGNWKKGLIVQGIEIRSNKLG